MAEIDPQVVETLLRRNESESLDFKEAAYRVKNATNEEKSEIVKDVLAFANAWRMEDAYIVLGVRENPGARATVIGLAEHVDDATYQQIVNGKRLNRPVAFEYVALTVEGKKVGVIRIPAGQERPLYLKKSYGKVKEGVVYVRRGSSTAEADADEIAEMGRAAVPSEPTLRLRLIDPLTRSASEALCLTSTVLREMPEVDESELPRTVRWIERTANMYRLPSTPVVAAIAAGNRPSAQEVRAYVRQVALLREVRLGIENLGQILARDVRVAIRIPHRGGLRIRDEFPERPHGPMDFPISHLVGGPQSSTYVNREDDDWLLEAHLGKIQPSASVWSDPFWIGSSEEGTHAFTARLFGDNVPRAIESELLISFKTESGWLEKAESAFYEEDE